MGAQFSLKTAKRGEGGAAPAREEKNIFCGFIIDFVSIYGQKYAMHAKGLKILQKNGILYQNYMFSNINSWKNP